MARDMSLEIWGRNQIRIWWFLSIALFAFGRYSAIKFNGASDLPAYLSLEYFSLALFAISVLCAASPRFKISYAARPANIH
jgi:hypothetical protein